jgi:hypothetical protein
MASGHVKRRIRRPDTWQLRPAVHQINKALANPEPSTHGAKRTNVCALYRHIESAGLITSFSDHMVTFIAGRSQPISEVTPLAQSGRRSMSHGSQ